MKLKLNWAAPVVVLFCLWLGFTDRVDWWVIGLIYLTKLGIITEHKF